MTKNIFQNRLHFKSTKSNHVTSPHHETPGKKNKIFPNSFGGKARSSGPRTDDNDTSSSIRSSKEEDSNGDDDISVKMEVQSSRVWVSLLFYSFKPFITVIIFVMFLMKDTIFCFHS